MGTVVYRQFDQNKTVNAAPRLLWLVIASSAMTIAASAIATPGPGVAEGVKTQASAARDGAHDFDFALGTWRTHIQSLEKPLTGSYSWESMEGTKVSRTLWSGRAQWEEIEATGTGGRIEGGTLVIYNPEAHQWTQTFVSSDGVIGTPLVGEFKNGVGRFFAPESFNGRTVLARATWSEITRASYRYEAAFSDDGGRSWETHFVAHLERKDP
jgi:hypothetical protein